MTIDSHCPGLILLYYG